MSDSPSSSSTSARRARPWPASRGWACWPRSSARVPRNRPGGRNRSDRQRNSGPMKYLDEFADPDLARHLLDRIHAVTTQPWAIMEVSGGQTHSIIRHGIDQLLPELIELTHGPGCPVCVTPVEIVDRALAIAARPEVIFCSFGDMLRVTGTSGDLFGVKSEGG